MFFCQALPAVEYSSNVREWHAAQMVPDLAMLVLIATYVGLVVYDTVATWSIELKSRRKGGAPQSTQANKSNSNVPPDAIVSTSPPTMVTRFRTRTSLTLIIFELCLCGVMLGAVATWYYYATALVQDGVFGTR